MIIYIKDTAMYAISMFPHNLVSTMVGTGSPKGFLDGVCGLGLGVSCCTRSVEVTCHLFNYESKYVHAIKKNIAVVNYSHVIYFFQMVFFSSYSSVNVKILQWRSTTKIRCSIWNISKVCMDQQTNGFYYF